MFGNEGTFFALWVCPNLSLRSALPNMMLAPPNDLVDTNFNIPRAAMGVVIKSVWLGRNIRPLIVLALILKLRSWTMKFFLKPPFYRHHPKPQLEGIALNLRRITYISPVL